ncbi:hypothetical protein RHS02_00619, partial [Rhizoctonia solani]
MSKPSDDNTGTYGLQEIDQEYGDSHAKSDSLAHVPGELDCSSRIRTPTLARPWWMLGFEKWTSLAAFFGGAIMGYSLAKAPMMSFDELLKRFVPGEGYWFEQRFWKISIMIHIFASLRAGIAGRRGQGGDLNTQSAFYMLASGAACAVIIGCVEARRGALDAHREWMIRAWFYNGALVTTNITALISAHVITAINTYYSLWRCAEVEYVLESSNALAQAYPQCATSNALSNPHNIYVSVHASWREGRLGRGSAIRASYGMALWIAMILHGVGIELYLRMTVRESKKLRELSEQKGIAPEQTELRSLRKTSW